MKVELVQIASEVRGFLYKNRSELKLPFLYMFPVNCCEIASLVLGKIFVDILPASEVRMVKAQKEGWERHFWLEVDGDVYDITADQFDGMDLPILGGLFNPLEDQYEVYEVSDICEELENNSFGIHMNVFSRITWRILGSRVDGGVVALPLASI